MLSGLRFEKKPDEEKTDKKSKKKERRKEQKKRKKNKKNKKDKKEAEDVASSASSGSAASAAEPVAAASAASVKPPPPTAASVVAPLSPIKRPQDIPEEPQKVAEAPKDCGQTEEDFFSKMGKEHKPKSKRPNPDENPISSKELNPGLIGGEYKAVASQAGDLDRRVEKKLTVGDGGAAWRNRAKRRQQQAEQEAANPEANDGKILKKLGSEGPADDGKRNAGRRDKSKSKSRGRGRSRSGRKRSRERSKSRGRGRSRSREQRKRGRGSPSPQRKRPREGSRSRSRSKDGAAGLRGRGANAAADWCKRNEKVLQERASKENAEEDMDAILAKINSKYGGASASKDTAAAAPSTQKDDDPEDGNELAALAMQAMLSGDMDRYEELNRRLEQKQTEQAAEEGKAPPVFADPTGGGNGTRVEVIEEVDAAGRSRKLVESVQTASMKTGKRGEKKLKGEANLAIGKDGKMEKGYYDNDDISLEDLIRKEKVEGVQDYDANLADHIWNNQKYKAVHEDDDEAYALGRYEGKNNQMNNEKLAARQQRQQVSEKQRLKHNMENCFKCLESKRCRLHDTIISSSTHAYVCMDTFKDSVLPGQVMICPQQHLSSATDLDDDAYAEIRNYQKCIVRYFDSQDPPCAVIFGESSINRPSREKLLLGAGPHAVLIAYPIELPVFSQARSFFKKAFDEAECEWSTQHKKVVETTAKGGVRAAIPKHFPYVHIDFSLGGGYAHVVENAEEFPKAFVSQTIAGMCELTVLDRAYSTKEQYWDALRAMRQKFQKEFDWTQSLH